jgi:hypothetical protein
MEKMISVINNNLESVVSGIKEHLIDVENTLNQVNQEIQTRMDIASQYKNEILDAKNTINDLESNIQSLNVQLADLNARYGNDFKEIADAAAREFNSKIKNDNAIIESMTNKIIGITEQVNILRKELDDYNNQKDLLEKDYDKTIVLSNFYDSKIKEIINFTINHPDQLENYISPTTEELNTTEEVNVPDRDSFVNDDIFAEIDKITSSEPDKLLVNEVIENVGNHEFETTYATKKQTEEDLSLTRQLDDVIKEANALISKNIEVHSLANEVEEKEDNTEEYFEPIFNKIEAPEDPILSPEDFVTSSISSLGLDAGSFRIDDISRISSSYDSVNASKVLDVLRKYNIDVDYVSGCPDILIMKDDDLDYILEILTNNGLNIKNAVYYINVLPYIDVRQLRNVAKNTRNKELTEIIYKCVGDDGNIYIDRYISMSGNEVDRLKRNSTKEDFRIINMFPEIVVENYNTLVNLKIDKASECLLDHPHRFIYNPDKFADILDKYELDDLIRCINKNPGVIDKL